MCFRSCKFLWVKMSIKKPAVIIDIFINFSRIDTPCPLVFVTVHHHSMAILTDCEAVYNAVKSVYLCGSMGVDSFYGPAGNEYEYCTHFYSHEYLKNLKSCFFPKINIFSIIVKSNTC